MFNNVTARPALLAALGLFAGLPVIADDGHDHAAGSSAPAVAVLPRFAAFSELFEIVAIADGRRLTLYLDRFDDNAPVKGARVELDVGGAKVALKEHADGEFEGSLAQALKPGITPVTAGVVAGTDTDLLAGEFDIHADEPAAKAAVRNGLQKAAWAALAIAALALVSALAWAGRRARGAA